MTLKQSIAAELRAQADGQPLQRTHIQLGGAAKFHCKNCKKDWSVTDTRRRRRRGQGGHGRKRWL